MLAIQAENLGKQYVIGAREQPLPTFREAIVHALGAPVRRWRRLRGDVDEAERFWALRDLDFSVEEGRAVGIVGPNGAGKTTLLKILSRITAPTTGQVTLRGRVASLLEVGTGFHPELTGRENIYLNGAILGMSREEIRGKFDEIAAFAEVDRFLDTPVKRYSSGMYVRLAFAVAAHLDPDILLVDEVLAVGDMEFQRKCLHKMESEAGRGRTVLFVSHNLQAVRQLCSDAILLNAGRIVCSGGVDRVLEAYEQRMASEGVKLAFTPTSQQSDKIEVQGARVEGVSALGKGRTDRPIEIFIRYRVREPLEYLRVGFDLCDGNGVALFRSFEDDEPARVKAHAAGEYETVGRIPADLLREGRYFVDLRVTVHRVAWLFVAERALSFEVENVSGLNSAYADPRPGVVGPRVEWERRRLGAGLEVES